jgi:hypothetical protein
LLGAWAGGGAVIGSEPVLTRSPQDLGDVLDTPYPGTVSPAFGGGWIGCLGYGFARDLLPQPPALTVTARTREGIPMALRHATQRVEGLQFHPESVLTIHGMAIMRNFVQAVGRWRTGSSWTQIMAQSATRVRGSAP